MLTIIAPPGSLTEAVGKLLADIPLAGDHGAMAIVDALPPMPMAPLDGLSDDDLERGCIAPLADLAATLAELVPQHERIVLIGSSANLGLWDGAIAGAFAAGAVGLIRSIALEFRAQGQVINMIAVPSADVAQAGEVAPLAAALLQSPGVNGQVIICDGGDNLRMMQARKMR